MARPVTLMKSDTDDPLSLELDPRTTDRTLPLRLCRLHGFSIHTTAAPTASLGASGFIVLQSRKSMKTWHCC